MTVRAKISCTRGTPTVYNTVRRTCLILITTIKVAIRIRARPIGSSTIPVTWTPSVLQTFRSLTEFTSCTSLCSIVSRTKFDSVIAYHPCWKLAVELKILFSFPGVSQEKKKVTFFGRRELLLVFKDFHFFLRLFLRLLYRTVL